MRAWRLPLAMVAPRLARGRRRLALPPLAIDAYPTTYLRPSVPYQAGAITGRRRALPDELRGLPRAARGAATAPTAEGSRGPLPTCAAPHTAQHTAGDLFWWISHGISGSGMPGFDSRPGEEQRWSRSTSCARCRPGTAPGRMGPTIERDRRWLVAPDFTFTVGPTPRARAQGLSGPQRRWSCCYCAYPARARMTPDRPARGKPGDARGRGHRGADRRRPDAIRHLGPDPRIMFPVVTEGAGDDRGRLSALRGRPARRALSSIARVTSAPSPKRRRGRRPRFVHGPGAAAQRREDHGRRRRRARALMRA